MAFSPHQRVLTALFHSGIVRILWRNLLKVAVDGLNLPWLLEFEAARWDRPTDGRAVQIGGSDRGLTMALSVGAVRGGFAALAHDCMTASS